MAKVATRTALAATGGPASGMTRFLTEPGREGTFVFSTANLATQVTADPQQGIYVAPASDTTGASGAWVRVPVRAQSSVISPAASASGASPNIAVTVNMPSTGTGQDVGLKLVGGTGSGSGKMMVFEKNRAGGEDFTRWLEYSATGFYYADNGAQSATHAISARINSGAAFETRKSILISGTVNLNGTPADPADRLHAPTFVQPNGLFNMLGIYADGPYAFSTRVSDSTPDNPNGNQAHWTMSGFGGSIVRVFWKTGDIGFIDNFVPNENQGLNIRASELFTWGRIGKRGCGPLNNVTVDKRGVSCVTAFTLAELNGKGPDAYIHPNALINCTDATLPGLYMSNGFQFVHVADATKIIGPDSFGWTPAYFDQSGGVIAASGTGNKTFAKTAGLADWLDAAYATTTITGDQLIEFTINDSTAAHTYMVGFASAVPTASPAYGPTQGNLYGALKPGSMNVRSVLAGVAGGTNYATIASGDIIGLRLLYNGGSNGTLTLEQNRSTVATLSTTVPLVALRPMVTFNQVNGSIANFRWRSL